MKFLEKFELFCKNKGIIKENGEINVAEFSRQSDIPATTISSWYTKGTENIKLSTFHKLRSFSKLTLDYWIDDNIDLYDYIYIEENEEKKYKENISDYPNAIPVYHDEKTGLSVAINPKDKSWEEYTSEEQEKYIQNAITRYLIYIQEQEDKENKKS